MSRPILVCLVVVSTSAFARELEVPLGDRSPLVSKKAIHEVLVRDPSLVTVVVTDARVSLEGKQSGVTGITVKYADGELERLLVVVGDGASAKGPRREGSQAIDLKQSAAAQAKAAAPTPKSKAKERAAARRAAIEEASGVVRSAVEAL